MFSFSFFVLFSRKSKTAVKILENRHLWEPKRKNKFYSLPKNLFFAAASVTVKPIDVHGRKGRYIPKVIQIFTNCRKRAFLCKSTNFSTKFDRKSLFNAADHSGADRRHGRSERGDLCNLPFWNSFYKIWERNYKSWGLRYKSWDFHYKSRIFYYNSIITKKSAKIDRFWKKSRRKTGILYSNILDPLPSR